MIFAITDTNTNNKPIPTIVKQTQAAGTNVLLFLTWTLFVFLLIKQPIIAIKIQAKVRIEL